MIATILASSVGRSIVAGLVAAAVAVAGYLWVTQKAYKRGAADMKSAVEKQNVIAAEAARKVYGTVDACYDAGREWNQSTGKCDD